ncbi:DHA2 family efflux MFS transporter permease subunit [Streptacidiphilus sp. EB129]|uniref:DHA2 family efflux MFS transporter permease subunit n=1 Tax=Streptacidiphilus sp. EB129 TaxID=3156262 RepID=UPI003519368E
MLALAQFVVVLDASIVNIALPSIGTALHFSQSSLSWVIDAYVLTFGGGLLLGGRLADLLGRRRLFIVGLVLFGAASFAGGVATTGAVLIAARVVQGVGGALLAPAALSLVTTIFTEGAERNKAMGVWGAVAGSGGAAGVLLGGVLTSALGWRWVLFVNVPVCLVAAALAPLLIAESQESVQAGRRGGVDLPGAATVTAGLGALVYALVGAGNAGWTSARTVGLLAAGAALLFVFVLIERRTASPLVPLRIFRQRQVSAANLIGLLLGAAMLGLFFVLTLFMQQVLGYSPLRSGLAQLPLGVAIIAAAGLASPLVTRLGVKPVLISGITVFAAGMAWLTRIGVHSSFTVALLGPTLLVAVGLGLAFVPLTIAATSGVPDHEAGLAGGLINTSQQIGGAVGLAVLATIATSRTNHLVATGDTVRAALTGGYQVAFAAGAALLLVAAAVTAVILPRTETAAAGE